jgi:RNA polymerase sigma-70 factor (ECF subfamily)
LIDPLYSDGARVPGRHLTTLARPYSWVNRERGCRIPAFSDPETKRARFEATALPFASRLYSAARRLTGSDDDAADLVQDTFLRAYRTFENFQPDTNCRAWLFTILYSIFLNERARRRPTLLGPEQLDTVAATDSELAPGESPWSLEVERALSRLPSAFRAAVLLVDVEELSYEEAAAAAGCPIGTLRSRLFRGRKLLGTMLRNHAPGAGFAPPTATDK